MANDKNREYDQDDRNPQKDERNIISGANKEDRAEGRTNDAVSGSDSKRAPERGDDSETRDANSPSYNAAGGRTTADGRDINSTDSDAPNYTGSADKRNNIPEQDDDFHTENKPDAAGNQKKS